MYVTKVNDSLGTLSDSSSLSVDDETDLANPCFFMVMFSRNPHEVPCKILKFELIADEEKKEKVAVWKQRIEFP